MSIVFINCHNESIYNVEKKGKAILQKPEMYHSKFMKQVRKETKAVKDDHRTMGYAEIPLNSTKDFLLKNGGPKPPRPKTGFHCNSKKPQVPKRSETAEIRHNEKNWKEENIKRVVSAAPRQTLPRYVDTKKGDFHDLKSSGLMPVYIYQEKYGKLPKYLVKRMKDLRNLREMYKEEDARKQPLCRYITQEERTELLGVISDLKFILNVIILFYFFYMFKGLKHNWEELQKVYQGLPLMTDTIPKMLRKTKLENELKQLEKDILLLENHPYIYIYKDDHIKY